MNESLVEGSTPSHNEGMHRVVVVAFDGAVPYDLATPCEVFERVRLPSGAAAYRTRVCGISKDIDGGLFQLRVRHGLREIARADTVVVPGKTNIDAPLPPPLRRALRAAADRGTRIVSICTGAFVLAACGLLDHKRATTHWLAAPLLAQRFPLVRVDPRVLYVDEGQILTSAGAAAGLDLCLHLVRKDFGAAVAAQTARLSVMPLEREGGQSQFIEYRSPEDDAGSLAPLLQWLAENLHAELSLARIARQAKMSVRSLNRRFKLQTGTTPRQWILHARIQWAQRMLETTTHSVEHIAAEAGFGSVGAFRGRFRRLISTSPHAYRRAFQGRVDVV